MRILATYHWRNGLLKDNDRVSNLCASPYLSYRIVHSVIENYPGKCSEIPVGCEMEFSELNDIVMKYESNVLAGINSTFLGLAMDLLDRGIQNKRVERILAGGELLYGKQREVIQLAFPNVTMVSFLFGTTESGIIGFSHLDDQLDVFRPFPGVSIVEIIDEKTNKKITTPGQVGKCVVTSLLRVAAPAIRIDTGDYAEWVDNMDSNSPCFRVLGRKFPFNHSINNAQFSETDIWALIKYVEDHIPITKLQVELHHDSIEVVYALLDGNKHDPKIVEAAINQGIYNRVPILHDSAITLKMRLENFSHFIGATRKKGRLIKDCRTPSGSAFINAVSQDGATQ